MTGTLQRDKFVSRDTLGARFVDPHAAPVAENRDVAEAKDASGHEHDDTPEIEE